MNKNLKWKGTVLLAAMSLAAAAVPLPSRLSEETGAESYYLGFGSPVTLKPYFDEIQMHLNNQYLVSFVGNGGKKGKFERVRVVSEIPNVEFLTPSEVFLPAVQ